MQRKILLKSIIISFVGFIGLVLIFCLYTILDAPLEKLNKVSPSNSQSLMSQVEIEELSTFNVNDLENYLLFSEGKLNSKSFIENALTKAEIEKIEGTNYLVKKKLFLPSLRTNDCERIFCYQSRMEFSQIPSLFWRGLIGVEDSRFLDHQGIDFKSILRAIIVDLKSMKLVQGGSTITQQLVKNLYFSNEKKLIRKLKELVLAVYLEANFKKEEILEAYFNEIYWGVKQGVYIKGIHAASLFYFSKKPSELSEFEVAILISLLKGPNFYNPLNKIDRLIERARYVFKRLKTLNYISSDLAPWNSQDWKKWQKYLELKQTSKPFYALYLASKNKEEILNSFEKYVLLKNIYQNLNIGRDVTEDSNTDVQLAVKALIYDFKSQKSFTFYSNQYRKLEDVFTEERHQVGSILKPIIYSFYLNQGKQLDDMVETGEIKLDLKSGTWAPKEAHAIEQTEVTLREALQLSYNRPVIRLAEEIGFEKLEEFLKTYILDLKVPLSEYPAQLLGAIELSMNEVFEAYKKFIEKECVKVSGEANFEDTVLYSMSDPSLTTIRRQISESFENLRFFGKTGTSNSGNDNWFIGFDGRTLSVLWFGNEGVKATKNLGLYGSTTSFRIYRNFLRDRGKQVGDIGCHYMN